MCVLPELCPPLEKISFHTLFFFFLHRTKFEVLPCQDVRKEYFRNTLHVWDSNIIHVNKTWVCAYSAGGLNGWVLPVSYPSPLLPPTTWAWWETSCSMSTWLQVRDAHAHAHAWGLQLSLLYWSWFLIFLLCSRLYTNKENKYSTINK